jgi:hypothetical protein
MEITSRIQTAIFIKVGLRDFFVVAGTLDLNAQHHI